MKWEVDPRHSSIMFIARHATVSNVKGRFRTLKGTLEFDGEDPTGASCEIEIETASVDTNIDMLNEHLRSEDYLDVEKYPLATFSTRGIERHGDGYRITGDLTLHGVTREVLLQGEFGGVATDHRGNIRTGFSAQTTINRRDYGILTDIQLPGGGRLTDDLLKIEIELEGTRRPEEPPD